MPSPAAVIRRIAIVAPLLLAGCGFQPVYRGGADGPVAAQLASVEIGLIPNRLGQNVRNELIDRMYRTGRPDKPSYRLDLQVTSSEQRSGFQKDATAIRGQVRVNAIYSLHDEGGRAVFAGQEDAVVGFSVVTDQYGILVNERDAYDRAVEQLTDGIVRRLSLHFRT